jgi:hypothetical protein
VLEEGDLESLERLLNQARSRLAEVTSHAARVAGNVAEAGEPKVSGKPASEAADAD